MGAQVKKTARKRKDLRPHMSERAPRRGAERKERRPWEGGCGEVSLWVCRYGCMGAWVYGAWVYGCECM